MDHRIESNFFGRKEKYHHPSKPHKIALLVVNCSVFHELNLVCNEFYLTFSTVIYVYGN